MANKYEKQADKLQYTRDRIITTKIGAYFDVIRDKSQKIAMEITIKADGDSNYLQEYNRAEKLAVKTNKELRPEYLKKDNFSKSRYVNEYSSAYIESLYAVENNTIANGYLLKLPKYTEKQFKKAINYPLSKFMNNIKMKNARSIDIEQIYTQIVSGVEQGLSLKNINKQLDITLGYRDPQSGKWIADIAERKGQQYKTQRVLRTEILRMRSTAETDQWINQQEMLPSKLQLVEVLDKYTRRQSVDMDGQIADKEGKFLYPNGQRAYAHKSGVAKWDINDRSTTITLDPEYPPEKRIQRDPDTGQNEVKPYTNSSEWVKEKGLKRNIYGEILY